MSKTSALPFSDGIVCKQNGEIDRAVQVSIAEGDDETDKESGKKKTSGLSGYPFQFIASGSYDPVDLFKKFGTWGIIL